jgi:oligoendopeptidase F
MPGPPGTFSAGERGGKRFNMENILPRDAAQFMQWEWSNYEPYYQDLNAQILSPENVKGWLAGWSRLKEMIAETSWRLYAAVTVDTTDELADKNYQSFLDDLFPKAEAANQLLKEKLLVSGLQPEGFHLQLRNLQAQAEIFRESNLPLLAQELKLSRQYDKVIGAQTVEWQGTEVTLAQLTPVFQDQQRPVREKAWRLAAERQLQNRAEINMLWQELLDLRCQQAVNADLSGYRAYRWKQLLRFDYSPDDCMSFHQAIEEVAVPAARRIYERRRQQLGVETLRPWDLNVDPLGHSPLRPFKNVEELEAKATAIFHRVDPQLGEYFEIMRREGLLDLENRKGKAPGGYCSDFPVIRRPFIFTNAVGLHEDVMTLLHEGGHAFHVFETASLPYYDQLEVGNEMAEVASMSMELLASPYLTVEQGGFYNASEAARARIEHLEAAICFWPYMAVVDAFQHWVYENPDAAREPEQCDERWGELWDRYMIGQDWNGLDSEKVTGWQRKPHILQNPYYYIEYGMAQLASIQVWSNSLADQAGAVRAYRRALSLGGTVRLPELYAAAGARFSFSARTLKDAVDLAECTIQELEAG